MKDALIEIAFIPIWFMAVTMCWVGDVTGWIMYPEFRQAGDLWNPLPVYAVAFRR